MGFFSRRQANLHIGMDTWPEVTKAALVERQDLLFAALLNVVEQVVERLLDGDAHWDLYGVSHCDQSSFRPEPGAYPAR